MKPDKTDRNVVIEASSYVLKSSCLLTELIARKMVDISGMCLVIKKLLS